MKFLGQALLPVALSAGSAGAFSSRAFFTSYSLASTRRFVQPIGRVGTAASMKMAMDPHFFSSILLSDETGQLVSGAIDTMAKVATPDDASSVLSVASDIAASSSSQGNGFFGFLTGPIEGLLQTIHSLLVAVGVSENAWGESILGMTLVIKLLTYPLTKSQLESTNKMQVSVFFLFLSNLFGWSNEYGTLHIRVVWQ